MMSEQIIKLGDWTRTFIM